MFYHNTRYAFPLPAGSPDNVAGGIIAASAMPRPQLARRKFKRSPYLQHRLFDPQLYLADLNVASAGNAVVKLGSYPWFGCALEEFQSGKAGGIPKWKLDQAPQLRSTWPGDAATDGREIATHVRACIEFQQTLGCEAIILPSPMTRSPGGGYAVEMQWLDAGLDACMELRIALPIYATIAIADSALLQLRPLDNPFLQTVTAQIGSRAGLAGAYVVVAQESEDPSSWICKSPDTLLSLLLIVDDIVRGAGRDVIISGMGAFGVVAFAAGARIWSTGYYRSQRRLRTSDFNDTNGRTVPRYYSTRLLGDVGVEYDLALLASDPRGRRVLTDTPASRELNDVLRAGGTPAEVPEWAYAPGPPTAAMAHYNHCMQEVASALDAVEPAQRIEVVASVLRRAESLAEHVRDIVTDRNRADEQSTKHTEFGAQRTWREVFDRWRAATGH